MRKRKKLARRLLRRVRKSALHKDRRAKRSMKRMAKRRGLGRAAMRTALLRPKKVAAPEPESKPKKSKLAWIKTLVGIAMLLRLTGGRRLHRKN